MIATIPPHRGDQGVWCIILKPGRTSPGELSRRAGQLGEANLQFEFLHVADYALIDQVGKLTVSGIWNVVSAEKFPTLQSPFWVAVGISIGGDDFGKTFKILAEIVNSDGQQVFLHETDFKVERMVSHQDLSLILKTPPFFVTVPGVIEIRLSIDGDLKKTRTLAYEKVDNGPRTE